MKHLLRGQHFGDCLLDGYGWDVIYHHPEMALTGKPPYPVERTLLTNRILFAGIDSLFQNQQRVSTLHWSINYQSNPESTFWRS